MGRQRKQDKDLPPRLHIHHRGTEHETYRYMIMVNGKTETMILGKNKAEAVRTAKKLNEMRRDERVKLLGVPRTASADVERQVFEDCNYKCAYCGATEDLGIDHVIPRAMGGSSERFNLVVSCWPCNGRKGDMSPTEWITHILLRAKVGSILDEMS